MTDAVSYDVRQKINNCTLLLRSCLEKNEKIEKSYINQILDDLSVLNGSSISKDEKFRCIRLCCITIAPSDGMLLAKCSQVVIKFIRNERISEEMVIFFVDWCLKSICLAADIAQTEILSILQFLIVHCPSFCKQFINDILRTLKDPLEYKTKLICPGEILLKKLNCIRELIPLMSYDHFLVVKDIIVQIRQKNSLIESGLKAKIILIELEILFTISEKSTTWLTENLGIILGNSLSFASYGLPHHVTSVPQYLLPTPLLCDTTGSKSSTNKSKKKRKQKKKLNHKIQTTPLDDIIIPELNWSQTSESDFSDSEMGRLAVLKKLERKIRLSSLALLLFIARNVEKKELIGYWPNMLSGPYSILKTLSADTSPRSRVTITSILSILFSSGKLYLSQAQHPPRNTNLPYFSWSHLLADLIESTHMALCEVISEPQSVGSILSILQCLAIFLSNTPYHRMNSGILKTVLLALYPLLRHADSTIRLASIKCLNEIVTLEFNTEEQILLMQCYDCDDSKLKRDSWIILYCLESIRSENLSVTVRAECWVLLGYLIKHHYTRMNWNHHLLEIFTLLRTDIEDNNVVVQQKAAKAFELMVIPLGVPEVDCGIDLYGIWLFMIQGPLVPMLQSTSGILASSAADCITNISPKIFEKLPERMRIFVMTALCGCVAHEDHTARSAAVRTLGTIVVFPFLSENIQIIYDVADRIVCAMKDTNLNVRSKAAWALGNLSDVLVDGRQTGIPIEEVPLLNILEQAVSTGDDHERVKAYTMRAIGNLLLLFEENYLHVERFRKLTENAALTLTYNAINDNNMKVRWNACYSLGNMLKNSLLLERISTNWQTDIFMALSKLIVSCSNFKVRKAAACALAAVTRREYYGDRMNVIFAALMKAFENSQNLPEFSEYKHQKNLIDQLCLTLRHACKLARIDDLADLFSSVDELVDTCKFHVVDLLQREPHLKPEFEEAAEHLKQLRANCTDARQENVIDALTDILIIPQGVENAR